MTKNQPTLEIIIVSFNSQFWLKKTLETVKKFYLNKTKTTVQVTVVDNNSSDSTKSMLKKNFKWTKQMYLSENIGFAGANNEAIKQSAAEYILLLNSDVEFTKESNLDLLLEYLESHSKVGVVTPRIEFTNGEIDPASHRGEPTPWAALTYFSKLEKIFPKTKLFGQYHQGYKNLNEIHQIDACSGAAFLVKKKVIDTVGLLDDRFFMYAEDLDWCKRIREAGFSIVYNPQVTVIHHKYKSGIKNSSQTIARSTGRHFYDTMLQYYDKHYRNKYPELLRLLIYYFISIKKGGL